MLVAIISDSHDNILGLRWAKNTIEKIGAEALIHLGDVVAPFSLLELKDLNVGIKHLVLGNNDGEKIVMKRVCDKLGFNLHEGVSEIVIDNRSFIIFHGFGDANFTRKLAISIAESGKYDAVLYGHTHQSFCEKIGNSLVINPGEIHGWISGIQSIVILDTSDMTTKSIHRPSKNSEEL